jgi:hypothetical protein
VSGDGDESKPLKMIPNRQLRISNWHGKIKIQVSIGKFRSA